MPGHKWTKVSRMKLSTTIRNRKIAKKVKDFTPQYEMNKLQPPEAQHPTVNVERLREYEYRRGLLDALACILDEVRHS